jgi:hypothetical protein
MAAQPPQQAGDGGGDVTTHSCDRCGKAGRLRLPEYELFSSKGGDGACVVDLGELCDECAGVITILVCAWKDSAAAQPPAPEAR